MLFFLFSLSYFQLLFEKIIEEVIFCYYGSWAGGRIGNGKFSVSDINPNLCTHITYTFIGLSTSGTVKLLDSGGKCIMTHERTDILIVLTKKKIYR